MSKAYTRAEWTKAEKSDRLGNGMRTTWVVSGRTRSEPITNSEELSC
jgi:hypothetical protein